MKIWRMRIACWITKAINTHSEYVMLIAFPLQQYCTNAPQRYVILTLPAFLNVWLLTTLFQVKGLHAV